MSDKELPTANGADTKYTAGDTKFFVTMFKYLPKSLDIEWNEFAQEMGLKDGSIAKVRCRQIRNKYGLNEPGTGSPSGTPTKSKKPATANDKVVKTRTPTKKKQQKPTTKVTDDVATGADVVVKDDQMSADSEDDKI